MLRHETGKPPWFFMWGTNRLSLTMLALP